MICKIISQHIIRSATLKCFSFSSHVHNNWFCFFYLPIWSIVCWVDKINHENQVLLKGRSERILIVIAFIWLVWMRKHTERVNDNIMAKAMSLMCTNNLYLTQNLCWLCFRWFRWRIRKLGQYHYINFFVLFRLFFSSLSFIYTAYLVLGRRLIVNIDSVDHDHDLTLNAFIYFRMKYWIFKKNSQWKWYNTTSVLLIFYVKLFYLIYKIPV